MPTNTQLLSITQDDSTSNRTNSTIPISPFHWSDKDDPRNGTSEESDSPELSDSDMKSDLYPDDHVDSEKLKQKIVFMTNRRNTILWKTSYNKSAIQRYQDKVREVASLSASQRRVFYASSSWNSTGLQRPEDPVCQGCPLERGYRIKLGKTKNRFLFRKFIGSSEVYDASPSTTRSHTCLS